MTDTTGGERPDLSVVIPSVNGWSDLEGCLRAVMAQEGGIALEVLVADRVGDAVRIPVRRMGSSVRLLDAPPRTTIPALRALAFRAASADVVAVIEDHVIVPPDWAAKMLAAQRAGAPVVGGSVTNGAEGVVDWAAFLCEYSHCLAPPEGPAEWVVGNNVTYRRDLLERFAPTISEEGWENRLHEAMRSAGVPLSSRPDIVVSHRKHYTVREYVCQRYLYARAWAGMRAGDSRVRRLFYGLASFALPPILLWRIVHRVIEARCHRVELIRSVPLLVIFVCAWAAGEVVGSLVGPGDALERVR